MGRYRYGGFPVSHQIKANMAKQSNKKGNESLEDLMGK
jgi:hypothetical protein